MRGTRLPIVTSVLAGVLSVLLAACGGDDDAALPLVTTTSIPTATATTTTTEATATPQTPITDARQIDFTDITLIGPLIDEFGGGEVDADRVQYVDLTRDGIEDAFVIVESG